MEEYIDIHNHSMFAVDDGAGSMEESLEMLQMAYDDGVRTIVLTPHAHYRRGRATPEDIREKVALLQDEVKERCPGLCLYPGNELYYDSAMPDRIEYGEVCRMADTNYVLVEFSESVEFPSMKKGFHEILCLGVMPILAHIERYACLREKKQRIAELWEMGVYFQANASGVMGLQSGKEKKFLKWVLQKGYLHFIASDAHDTKERMPLLSECAAYVQKKYGEGLASEFFSENPKKLLTNEGI